MGCASSNYFNENDNDLPRDDYFTRAMYLSKKLNKEEKYKKEKEENEKKKQKNEEEEEEEENEEEEEDEYIKNKKKKKKYGKYDYQSDLSNRVGPKSYFDNLIENEIPYMDFGLVANKKEIDEEMIKKEGVEKIENEEEEDEEDDDYYYIKNNFKIKDSEKNSIKEDNETFIEFLADINEINVIIIGEENSGKSSFIEKYTKDSFNKNHMRTDYIKENKDIIYKNDGKDILVNLIDTPPLTKIGEKIDIIQKEIYRSHCIIYIVNLTHEIPTLPLSLTFCTLDFNKKQTILVLGNKSDIKKNIVHENMKILEDFCKERKFNYESISCKEDSKEDITNIIDTKLFEVYFKRYEGFDTESSKKSFSKKSKSKNSVNNEEKSESKFSKKSKNSFHNSKNNSDKDNKVKFNTPIKEISGRNSNNEESIKSNLKKESGKIQQKDFLLKNLTMSIRDKKMRTIKEEDEKESNEKN
jgi:GTPase SAR1 family protein